VADESESVGSGWSGCLLGGWFDVVDGVGWGVAWTSAAGVGVP
jgi:hypothetical protein